MFRAVFGCAGVRVGGCAAGCVCGCDAVCAGGSADGFARVCDGSCSCDLVSGAIHSERCAALGVQGSWLRRPILKQFRIGQRPLGFICRLRRCMFGCDDSSIHMSSY